ncbi:MAG TPA: very short patch repair endonuclease [Bacteroidia bacterium]|nr:very short patch repair endonuclease [Bacteroidia bacterium]
MDRLTKKQRRKNMQAVKNKGSKIETILSKSLWAAGLRYRKNDKTVFGKPDFTFKKYKVAVFCDSEFWHGKNWNKKKHEHRSNQAFWHNKIEKNIQRDKLVNKTLKSQGWRILRFWGKDIENRLEFCTFKIQKALDG